MSIKTIVFNVNDMHCQSCPKLITLSLKDLNGVSTVNASLEKKEVIVNYYPDKVTENELLNAIKESGYTPQVKSTNA